MRVLAFDIESCSGDPTNGSMCSFGYVLADETYAALEAKDILINPRPRGFNLGRWGAAPILKLAYPESTFRAAPKFPGVYAEMKTLLEAEDTLVAGFAVANDIRYLNNACDIYHLPRFQFKYLDIQLLLKLQAKTRGDIGLSAAAEKYEIALGEHHRSDEDARVALLVLAAFCKAENATLNEVCARYEICFGINGPAGCSACGSPLYYEPAAGFPPSRKMKEFLLAECLMNQKRARGVTGVFAGKSVGLSPKFSIKNIDRTRRIVQKLNENGARWTENPERAKIFVYDKAELGCQQYRHMKGLVEHGRKVLLLEKTEFLEMLGELPATEYNDKKTLFAHYMAPSTQTTLKKKE